MELWVWIASAVAGMLLADAAVLLFAVWVALPIFEQRPPFNVQRAELDPQAEDLRFPALSKHAARGSMLAGSLWKPTHSPRGLIVFCPEFEGTRWSAPRYAGGLIAAGYAVLALDFRGQGDSDKVPGAPPMHWLTRPEVGDVLAALGWVTTRDDLKHLPIGLFGISRGANAALAAAARSPQVQAVAAEGAFSTDAMLLYYAYRWAELYVPRPLLRRLPAWHLRRSMRVVRRVSQWRRGVRYTILERVLPRLTGRPVLLITGGRDSYVTPVIAERLRTAIGPACGPLWIVPGAKHNQARPTAPEEYDRRLLELFDEMRPHSAAPQTDQLAPTAPEDFVKAS